MGNEKKTHTIAGLMDEIHSYIEKKSSWYVKEFEFKIFFVSIFNYK